MEGSFATLSISAPSSDFPFAPKDLDIGEDFSLEEEWKKFCDSVELSRTLSKALSVAPPYSEDPRLFYPGLTDCYRLKREEDREWHMALYSGKALAYFNKANNTDYKFENFVELNFGDMDHCYAAHCNFTAKPEKVPLKAGDFSSKLFFAEFIPMLAHDSVLTYCSLLDGDEANTKNSCLMCPSNVILHPTTFKDGFKFPLDGDLSIDFSAEDWNLDTKCVEEGDDIQCNSDIMM